MPLCSNEQEILRFLVLFGFCETAVKQSIVRDCRDHLPQDLPLYKITYGDNNTVGRNLSQIVISQRTFTKQS